MAFGTETLQWAIIFSRKYLKLSKVEADPFFYRNWNILQVKT